MRARVRVGKTGKLSASVRSRVAGRAAVAALARALKKFAPAIRCCPPNHPLVRVPAAAMVRPSGTLATHLQPGCGCREQGQHHRLEGMPV